MQRLLSAARRQAQRLNCRQPHRPPYTGWPTAGPTRALASLVATPEPVDAQDVGTAGPHYIGRGTSFQPIGIGAAMTYPSSRWFYPIVSDHSTQTSATTATIPTVGEADPDSAPDIPRLSTTRQDQYTSVCRNIVPRLPSSADHALIFVGHTPDMEQLAAHLVLLLADGRTVNQMKQVLCAREIVDMVCFTLYVSFLVLTL